MNAPMNVALTLRRLFIPLLVACASLSSCDFFVSSWDGPTVNSPWARSVSGADADATMFYDVCADASGNYYAVGQFNVPATSVCDIFGDGVSVSGSSSSTYNRMVVVKYDSRGKALWARTSYSTGASVLYGVAMDSSGNVYACGKFSGIGSFSVSQTISATGVSTDNALLVKYDSSGTVLWARAPTSGGASSLNDVSVDSSGNVYVCGYKAETSSLYLSDSVYTSVSGYVGNNTLVGKYNSDGTAQWARANTVGPDTSILESVVADDSGNVYGVGYIQGNGGYNFGSGLIYGSSSAINCVIVKYNVNGTCQWARSVSAASDSSQLNGLARDSSGNLYAAGNFSSGAISFAGRTASVSLTGISTKNCCLIKLDSDGYALWGRTTSSGTNKTGFTSIGIDASGNAYCFGYLVGTTATSFGSVSAAGVYNNTNSLIVKYSPSGTALSAKVPQVGGGQSNFEGGCVDRSGNPVGAGFIFGTTTFSYGGNVAVAGPSEGLNALLVKYLGRE